MKPKDKHKSASDERLLHMYAETKDADCMAELWQRYSALVYGLCLNLLKNKQDSLDAVSSIFELLMEKAENYQVEHFRSWLYTLSKNHCLAVLRKFQRRQRIFEDFAAGKILSLTDPARAADERQTGIETKMTDNEDVELLKNALGGLPGEQATCIRLFYFDGYSYAEIAELTGWPLGKVKSHMQNGRRTLKITLAKTQ
ncbi:MAG: RNA polymerase sigma factor [Bacteroidales bacterium]